jgi:pyridoxine kinase
MTSENLDAPRAVIVISSHVARGSVGNRAAVFALETLGYPVWAVPTVILPWHPGHGRATRIVPDPEQFSALMRDLENAPWLGEVAGVLSGYLGDASQAAAVASLVKAVRAKNPDALYVCDPVMGDLGGLYVPETLAVALRDTLLPLADIATPNRYELEWIVGQKGLDDQRAVMEAAMRAGPPNMLVTSAPAMMAGSTANLLVTPTSAFLAEHRTVERPPNGLGDLTGAVFLARLLSGQPMEAALQSTTAAVFEILARTSKRGGDELQLETDAQSLSNPMAMVHMRRLLRPGRDKRA